MKNYAHEWDLHPDRIILNKELNIDQLGWKAGDYFKVVNYNGQAMLLKVDSLTAFVRDGAAELAQERHDLKNN